MRPDETVSVTAPTPALAAPRERRLLWLLAGFQFTHVLDFMMMTPLSPQFMRLWGISAQQFGLLVSIYAVAAAAAGLAAAFVIDRFDRRRALLFVYAGFVFATLACALAPGYWSFLVARGFAGMFGGVIGSIVLAIAGDVIPAERRGRAMGLIMSAFPIVSVAGVPGGLFLATRLGWHAPFFVLAALSATLWICIFNVVPRIDAHVRASHGAHQGSRGMLGNFLMLFSVRAHRIALLTVFAFAFSGFLVFPFMSAYQVSNVGISEAELVYVFLAGGLATIFTSRLIGGCADRFGARRVFVLLACASVAPILAMTHLPRVPLAVLLVVTVPFMVLMSGRFIPLMALVTTCVHHPVRGAFMSLSSAAQNLAAGIASLLAGAMIGHSADGALTGYGTVGIVSVVLTLTCIALVRRLVPASRADALAPAAGGA